ncbi:hypothetical protein [Leeia aquatica]|uniref:Uncharacterized protein n=1 Tax=Leeia aquatica TaxID=2725557 RepID=A0A847S623_9NEIS|nr:hypothetical protein [Leeia aquatica]NLR74255.1 hypothetical protein [Leeia aquatica]
MKKPLCSVQAGFLLAPGAPFWVPALLVLVISPSMAGFLLCIAAFTNLGALLLGVPVYRFFRYKQINSLPAYLLAGAMIGAMYNQLVFSVFGNKEATLAFVMFSVPLLLMVLIGQAWPQRWSSRAENQAAHKWLAAAILVTLYGAYLAVVKAMIGSYTFGNCLAITMFGAVPATLSSLIFWLLSVFGTPKEPATLEPDTPAANAAQQCVTP